MADLDLRILLSAVGAGAVTSAIGSISSALGSGGLGAALAATGVAAGAAAIGLGVASVNAASQFQTAMDQNVAHAGLAKDQVDKVTQSLLQMGPAVGQSPTQLAQAMYPVLSSLSGISNEGAKTALALDEVKLASQSVAGSTTSVTDVTNAASAAFNAYGLQTNNATTNTAHMNNLFDVMNKTVSDGNMQWSNYSAVVGKLSVASHSAGVSFNETNSALATLTNSGYSAQLAGNYLGNMYSTLYIKGDTVAKNAKSIGLAFDATKYKTMDLGQRLAYLKDITGGNQTELLKLMNGNGVALKSFDALSNSIGQYNSNLDDLNHAQGATDQAFKTTSSSFSFAMQKLQAAGQSLLITIGLQLLPVLTNIVTAVVPVVISFTEWIAKSQVLHNIIAFLGTVVKNIGTFIQQQAIPAIKNIIDSIVSWENRTHTIRNTLDDLGTIIKNVGDFIQQQAVPAIKNIIGAIGDWWNKADLIHKALDGLKDAVTNAKNIIQNTINTIQSIVNWFNQWHTPILVVAGAITAFFVPAMIKAGIEAAVNGAKIGASFISSLVKTGIESVINGAKTTASFVAAMAKAGLEAVVNGAKVTASFVASLIKTGLEGWSAAIKLGTFIGSLIASGVQAVISAAQVTASFIASMVQAGIKAVVAGAQIVGSFVASLITTAAQAAATGATMLASLLPALVSVVAEAVVAAATAIPGLVAGFAAWAIGAAGAAAATIAATWPILAIIAIIALVVLAIMHWSTIVSWFQGMWSTAWGAISGAVSNAWGAISGALSSLWNNISGWFTNLASQAIQWGSNIITNLASGITGAIGNVTGAIGNVVNAIGNFLPHSPAKEGELSHLNEYGPALVAGFSHGILQSIPMMTDTMGQLTGGIGAALATPVATGFSADPSTRADQLSFSTPTMIYHGASKPHETSAVRKEEHHEAMLKRKEAHHEAMLKKKEEHHAAMLKKKEEHHAAAAEKKHVHVVINELKHEMHIHAPNAHLTKEQVHGLEDRALHEFGKKLADEIRAQFGNV